jgi:hypothetical protein
MDSTSQQSESVPTSLSRIDLAAIAEAHPVNVKVAVLDLNTFDATQLTLLEVLDMAEIAEVDPAELGALLGPKANTARRMRMLYAMAWCIARRANTALTFDEVCTWKLEVVGEVDPARAQRNAKRASTIVGAAITTGLPPAEAQHLTVAELSAYADKRRRRSRRKAG